MRRIIVWLIMAVFALTLAACAVPAGEAGESTAPNPHKSVVFADPVLEEMVRASLGRPEGNITVADAEAVTRLDLSFELQQYISEETPITDIGGLEYFVNLECLDLSYHAITDIAPLAGLTKLTSLSLGNNPVTDISPLSGLTNLKGLDLSGCAAQDYSALSQLTGLEYLMLNNSSITDASPLASLTNLKRLYLGGCVLDYSPLLDIYPNLIDCDFVVTPPPSTLAELDFSFDDNDKLALYQADQYDIRINHSEWGDPPQQEWTNCIRVVTGSESGYKIDVGFYPEHNAYVVWMFDPNAQELFTYVYDVAANSFNCERADMEPIVRRAFGDADDTDILLTPISYFDSVIQEAVGIPLETLCSMPFDDKIVLQTSYEKLGFVADQGTASYLFEQHEPWYFTVQIHNPEWGSWEGGGEVRFFTPLSEEYSIVVTYFVDEKRYNVGADDNDGGGAEYSFLIPDEHTDVWCSDENLTVEQYFLKAINDPSVTDTSDVYQYSVKLMVRTVEDKFGMSIDELYALTTS